jgi:DnaJ like chaperone protein
MRTLIQFISAIIGFSMGGFFGAIVGFIIGELICRLLERFGGALGLFNTHANQIRHLQNIFFTTTFKVMGYVAKSDGRISEEEIRAARFVMQRMGLNEQQRQLAIQMFNQGKQLNFDLDAALTQLAQSCQNNHALLQMFVEIQYQAAAASLSQSQKKLQILQHISQRLGYKPFAFAFDFGFGGANAGQQYAGAGHTAGTSGRTYGQQGYYRPSSDEVKFSALKNAYDLLGVKENATIDQIKHAYRVLMSQNHPDKLVSKGLPEEMIKMATEKTQNITKAYDLIRESRGF